VKIRPHPHRGRYESQRPEDPDLPVDLLLIARPAAEDTYGAWVVRGALVGAPSSEPSWVPGWMDPAYADSDPRVVWNYLRDTGANGVNWEVLQFKIETLDHAAALAGHYSAELTADGHPHGLTGGSNKQPVKEMPPAASDPEERDQSPDPCDTHFHMSVPYPVAEALSWRLAVEIVRRHPKDLWLVQTNPFGDYDCLTLRSITHPAAGPSIHIPRHGHHAQIQWFGAPSDAPASPALLSWGDYYAADDPRAWLRNIDRLAGLAAPIGPLPASTPSSLALRWIAAFLTTQLGSRKPWHARTVWHNDGPTPDGFSRFPAAAAWLRNQPNTDAASRVWFLRREGIDEVAVGADGTLWRAEDAADPVDLMTTYRDAGSNLIQLLARTAADLAG
jgi:hypothetical protein